MKELGIIVLILLCFILVKYNDNTIMVSSETDTFEYDIYYLIYEDNTLNTLNFNEYFQDDIRIIGIYPVINKIYYDLLKKDLYYFAFDFRKNESNIKRFTNYYLSKLDVYKEEQAKYKINGIGIKSVRVYSNINELKNYIMNYSNVKYDTKYE